ncbi:hypothetical protein ACG9XX_15415 [Acinetobacter baumannii]
MAVTDKHPQYIAAQKSWEIMRDAVAGEEQIKQAQTKYLAKSAGMIEAEKQGDTAVYRVNAQLEVVQNQPNLTADIALIKDWEV